MKVLVALDKFKGSLSAQEACNAVKAGILKFDPSADVKLLPLADGGEGSLDVIESKLNFKRVYVTVSGPKFEPIYTWYGIDNKTAYIEMANASGLLLLKKEDRHALSTTTLGTGQLIIDALNKGAKKIYLFVGGSATNDAGIGVAHALGFRFLNSRKELLIPVGASLNKIVSIDDGIIPEIAETEFILVTDVKNPLFGSHGAAKVFAKQKGANSNEINILDSGLRNFNEIVKSKWNKDISQVPGAGAAGGLGGGAMIFLNAKAKTGISTIMEILDFDSFIKEADLVISGEGKFDHQTLEGKVIKGVMNRCSHLKKPLGIVCGILDIEKKMIQKLPIHAVEPIFDDVISMDNAMKNAYSHLVDRSEKLIQRF